jgi:hypothetical protein
MAFGEIREVDTVSETLRVRGRNFNPHGASNRQSAPIATGVSDAAAMPVRSQAALPTSGTRKGQSVTDGEHAGRNSMNVARGLGEQRREHQVQHEGEGRGESEHSGADHARPIMRDEEDAESHGG